MMSKVSVALSGFVMDAVWWKKNVGKFKGEVANGCSLKAPATFWSWRRLTACGNPTNKIHMRTPKFQE